MGAEPPTTFDALVARPDDDVGRWAGMAPIEDLESVVHGVRNGSWLEGGLGFASLGGDVVAAGFDPIGTGLSWAAAWVIEQVTPLREALESVAGAPAKVAARAQTLRTIESSLTRRAEAVAAGVHAQTWAGGARAAYGGLSGRQLDGVACLAKGCGTVAVITEAVGMVVAFVRDTVRDLIADCVAQLAKAGVIALIPGAGTASAIASAVALIAKYAVRIAELLKHLLKSIRNLGPFFRRVGDRIAETIEVFRKATSPAFAADGPGTHWMMSGGGSEPPSSGRRAGGTPPSKPPGGTDDLPGAETPPDTVPDTQRTVPGADSASPSPDSGPPQSRDTEPQLVGSVDDGHIYIRGVEDGRIYDMGKEGVPDSGMFELVDNTPDPSLLPPRRFDGEGNPAPPDSGKFEVGDDKFLELPLDTPPPLPPLPPPASGEYYRGLGPYPTEKPPALPESAPPDSVRTEAPPTPPLHDWMDEHGNPHFTGSDKPPVIDDVPAAPGSSEKTLPSASEKPLSQPPESWPPSSEPPEQP